MVDPSRRSGCFPGSSRHALRARALGSAFGLGPAPRRGGIMLCLLVLAGCGLDPFNESPGGSIDLPTVGAGPYTRFDSDDSSPVDEPFVLFDREAELYDPEVLTGGAGLRIWMTREVPGPPDNDQQIFYAEVPSVHDEATIAPRLALAADQAWEEGRVAAPTVVDQGGGQLVMFYEGGVAARAIGRADSSDDGATWTKLAAPVLADATAPAAALADDRFELYVTRPDAPGIWRATGTDIFTLDGAPIVVARPGLAKAFDAGGVADPEIVIDRETTGRLHWGLFFVGDNVMPSDAANVIAAVGYAGSFDGVTWDRFGGAGAQLAAPATGPAVILSPAHGLMLYVEVKRGNRSIAAAHNP